MGEAPRARITAQNTLTTWHADRLYGAMVIDIEHLVGDIFIAVIFLSSIK